MCSTPCRCALTVINMVFGFVGIVIGAFGALLIWAKPIAVNLTEILISKLSSIIQEQLRKQVDEIVQVIMRMSSKVGFVILVFGCIILAISLLGYFGSCCNSNCFLLLYVCIVSVIALAHAIALIIWFVKPDIPLRLINVELNQTVYKYKAVASNEPESLVLALLMPLYKCCGYLDGNDFKNSTNFWRNDTIGNITYNHIEYPVPCCKSFLNSTNFPVCPYSFTWTNSFIGVGCREKVKDNLVPSLNTAAFVSIGVLAFEVIVFMTALIALKF